MALIIRHLITGMLLFALLAARAQAEGASAAPKEVSLRFTVFALGGMEGLAYQPKAAVAVQPLKFFSAYRSPSYHYQGAAQMRFVGQTATGEPPVTVAFYTIPEGAKSRLLLFFPVETPSALGLKYEVVGVEDGADRTPTGCFSTINVSGREYVAQYGATRIVIPRGIGEAHAGKSRVALLFASQMEGRLVPAGRHEFSMGARDRVTLIFYPPASQTGIYPIIRRLVDTPPAADPKAGDYTRNP